MKRSSTSARIMQDAIMLAVRRHDCAMLEDIRLYARMKLPEVSSRTVQRHLAILVEAGVVLREGVNNHFTYRLSPTETVARW